MKRFLASLLAVMVLLSCCSALAEYDTHVSFTLNATHSNSNMDYTNDDLYDYISNMFNFDCEVYPVSKDAQSEKIRIWINGGTMPDTVGWRDFNYQEYVIYAEQGLIAPLPEGWEEKYPELYGQMIGCMGEESYQKFLIDGACYGIPHARNYRFTPVATPMDHGSVYYRKDWAEKLGFHFGDVITLSELKAYLKACIDNDMAGNGNTLGMSNEPSYVAKFWMLFADVDFEGFYKTENGYAWGFANPTVLEAIKTANAWYHEGVLDPDFYLNQSAEAISNFTSGISACMFHNCAISSCFGYRQTFEESTGLDSNECVAIATIATDDGVTRAEAIQNWWSVSMFSPETSPEVLDRILAMMNYCASEEGNLTVMLGIRGKIWDYDADGNIVMLGEPDADGNYPNTVDLYNSYNIFRSQGVNPDDFSFINPSNDRRIVEPILNAYAVRDTGFIVPLDIDYEFFSSDAKANYSLDLSDEIAKLVIGDADTLEAEWQAYIAENQSIWQPVIDDLNAAFFN